MTRSRSRFFRSGVLALLLAAPGSLATAQHAPEATPVPTWGPDGLVYATTRVGNQLIVGGGFVYVGPPTGSLAVVDAGTGELVGTPAFSTTSIDAIVSDGAGGWFVATDPTYRGGRIVHLLPGGTVDPNWHAPAMTGRAFGIAVDAGRVVVGGDIESVGGEARTGLAAFDRATGAVLAWSPALSNAGGAAVVGDLAIADGALYIGGQFTTVDGTARTNAAALDLATGAVLPFFNADTELTLRIQIAGDRVYVAGWCKARDAHPANAVCAFSRDTGARLAWNPISNVTTGVSDLYATSTAVVVAYGNGSPDPGAVFAFDPGTGATLWTHATDRSVDALAGTSSRVFAAGLFRNVAGEDHLRLASFDLASGAVVPWGHAGEGARALATDGTHVVVGGLIFNSAGGVPRRNVAAIDLETGRLTALAPNVDFTVHALTAVGSVVVAGGDRFFASRNMALFTVPTGLELPIGLSPNGEVEALATDGTRLFIGGRFTAIGSVPRQYAAAVDLATGQLLPWNPRPDRPVTRIRVSSGTVYLVGFFGSFPGAGRNTVAAFDVQSGDLLSFNPQANGPIADVGFWRDRVLVAGEFTEVGHERRDGMAWVDRISGSPLAMTVDMPRLRVGAIARSGDTFVIAGSGFSGLEARALDGVTGRVLPWRATAYGPLGGGLFVAEGYPDLVALGGILWRVADRPSSSLAVFRAASAGAPHHVTGSVAGSTATVGWQPGSAPAATSFIVEVGTASGAADLGRLAVGSSTTITGTLAPGTYYTRVRGVAPSGEGAPSSEVIVTVPATPTPPNAPAGLTSSVVGGTVALRWSAAAGNATTYVLDVGTQPVITNIGSLPLGHLDTTFATAAPAGTYFVRVRAVNAFGSSASSNEVQVVVP